MGHGETEFGQQQKRYGRRYNQNRQPNPFKVGDLVYYKNHPISHAGKLVAAKLMPRYKGTFKIDSVLTPVTVKLVHPVSGIFITRAHLSLIKPGPHNQDYMWIVLA